MHNIHQKREGARMKNKLDRFILKIALLNALGFCLVVGATTFIDARLTSHVVFGARNYPLGFLICLGGPFIFLLSCIAAFKNTSNWFKIVFPTMILSVAGLASLPNFLPEFPHAGITAWLLGFCLLGLGSSWIHYFRIPCNWISDPRIGINLKIERVKEHVKLWRTVAISLAFGYLALLVPWSNIIWAIAPKIATKDEEIAMLSNLGFAEVVFVSIYVLVGPVWEAFRKAHDAADLFLELRTEESEFRTRSS